MEAGQQFDMSHENILFVFVTGFCMSRMETPGDFALEMYAVPVAPNYYDLTIATDGTTQVC